MVVGEPEAQPEPAQILTLDSLKRASVDVYWQEVAQLMVQGEMARNVGQRDNARARAMEQMFGLEFDARGLQRAWREANEAERARIRTTLEKVMGRHLDIEDQLMALEIADATRRLEAVRAEAAKRKEGRAERVRSAVDNILRDAETPSPGSRRSVKVF
jgi:hypothetical protein